MADTKPPAVVNLTWDGGLKFVARERGHQWVLDGRSIAGPSPVIALAGSLAGCMSIDVVHILTKGRFKVNALTADLTALRAPDDPRRIVRVDLHLTLDTAAPADQIQRALDLSHAKYCSVWHSMRQDIEFHATFDTKRVE
ncbi:MAG: OsmC family protein [Acidobacteriota bacterium]